MNHDPSKTNATIADTFASLPRSIGNSFLRFQKTPAFAGFILFLIALALNITLQGMYGSSFFTVRNINTIFSKNTPFILVSVAQGILLIVGTMDISCGIQLALVNVIIIMTGQEMGLPFPVSALLGIAAAVLISVVCWVFCSGLRLPALLVSFALTYIIRGINVLIMDLPQGKVEKLYYQGYDSQLFGVIPVSLLAVVFVLLLWLYLRKTRFGTHVYAVGGSQRDAFAAGISPIMTQLKAFILKGVITGLAGVCLTLMTASGNPLQAEDYGLRSLAACIIGGLGFGGWGTISCAVFGSGFYVLIQNSVYYLFSFLSKTIPNFQSTSYWQNFVSDIILFLGLLMTIVTAKGQREALKQGIVRQLRMGENYKKPIAPAAQGGERNA